VDIECQLAQLKNIEEIKPFAEKLTESGFTPFLADTPEILQINVGRRCNIACRHCHVEASPNRSETMPREILERCLKLAEADTITTIDITGGSPEMNNNLEWFIGEVSKLKKRLIVRTNLSILTDERYKRFIDIYTDHRVEVVTSLPDYQGIRTDKQRGNGVFDKVIGVMKELNKRGYALPNSGLLLHIVHNPSGAFLPASQSYLEDEYRKHLLDEHGVKFNSLFVITNMPIGRFMEFLMERDNYEDYMAELANAYNMCAADKVMCRNTLSVSWDGFLYDCDFNQILLMPINSPISNIMEVDIDLLKGREIVVGNHCYGCTAGSGSSCQGATS